IRTWTGFSLVSASTIANASSTTRSAWSFLPCMRPCVLMTFPEVFSPVPPLMSLFARRSTTLTWVFPSPFLTCLPNVCGTSNGLSETVWAMLRSLIWMFSREYFPKSLSIRLPLGLLLPASSEHLEIRVVDRDYLVANTRYRAHLASLGTTQAGYDDLVVLVDETYRLVSDRMGADDLAVFQQLDLRAFDEAGVGLLLLEDYLLQDDCF